jgi:hypothetical protein
VHCRIELVGKCRGPLLGNVDLTLASAGEFTSLLRNADSRSTEHGNARDQA